MRPARPTTVGTEPTTSVRTWPCWNVIAVPSAVASSRPVVAVDRDRRQLVEADASGSLAVAGQLGDHDRAETLAVDGDGDLRAVPVDEPHALLRQADERVRRGDGEAGGCLHGGEADDRRLIRVDPAAFGSVGGSTSTTFTFAGGVTVTSESATGP